MHLFQLFKINKWSSYEQFKKTGMFTWIVVHIHQHVYNAITVGISYRRGTGAYFVSSFFVRMLGKCPEACIPPTSHLKISAHILSEV